MKYWFILVIFLLFSCTEKKTEEETIYTQPAPFTNLENPEMKIVADDSEPDAADLFTDSLDGTWIKRDKTSLCIVNYNKDENEIIMYDRSENLQEVYKCSAFSKTRQPNTFYMVGTNDMIPFIRMNFTIQLFPDDKCWITVKESGIKNEKVIWTGSYVRMTGYADSEKTTEPTERIYLSGIFTGNNIRFHFSDEKFKAEINGEKKNGIFSVYIYNGKNILELRYLDKEGRVTGSDCYELTYRENETEQHYLGIITMKRGTSTPTAFLPYGEEDMLITQYTEKLVE